MFILLNEIIFLIRPKIFAVENLKKLLSHNRRKLFQYIINLLSKNKIENIEFALINIVNYGIS